MHRLAPLPMPLEPTVDSRPVLRPRAAHHLRDASRFLNYVDQYSLPILDRWLLTHTARRRQAPWVPHPLWVTQGTSGPTGYHRPLPVPEAASLFGRRRTVSRSASNQVGT